MTKADREKIAKFIVEDCYDDPALFHEAILGGLPFWSGADRGVVGQKEWGELLVEYAELVLVSGNNLGKSVFLASCAVWWACTRPYSTVVIYCPSLAAVLETAWENIGKLINGHTLLGKLYKPRIDMHAKISRGGSSRPNITFSNGSRILGIAANKEENCSGFHVPDLFVILEEASGLPQFVYNALGGLGARRTLICGNPLSIDGGYYQRYLTAVEARKKNLPPASSSIAVRIPTTDSPHAQIPHSPWGIADKTMIDRKREEEGVHSHWYKTHVLAEWPTQSAEVLFDIDDVEYAFSENCRALAEEYRKRARPGSNTVWIAADVATGVGKAKSVLIARDDYGVLEMVGDDHLGVEATASLIVRWKHKYGVYDSQIVVDSSGNVGTQMTAALKAEGVTNHRQFFGGDMSAEWGRSYGNARSAVYYALANRLTRGYFPGLAPGTPFSIPYNADLIEELRAIHGVARGDGKSALEDKSDTERRLKRSPDYSDALAMSFMPVASRK